MEVCQEWISLGLIVICVPANVRDILCSLMTQALDAFRNVPMQKLQLMAFNHDCLLTERGNVDGQIASSASAHDKSFTTVHLNFKKTSSVATVFHQNVTTLTFGFGLELFPKRYVDGN